MLGPQKDWLPGEQQKLFYELSESKRIPGFNIPKHHFFNPVKVWLAKLKVLHCEVLIEFLRFGSCPPQMSLLYAGKWAAHQARITRVGNT